MQKSPFNKLNISRHPVLGWLLIILILSLPVIDLYIQHSNNQKKDTVAYRKYQYDYAAKYCGHQPSIYKHKGGFEIDDNQHTYTNPGTPAYSVLLNEALTPYNRVEYACSENGNQIIFPKS